MLRRVTTALMLAATLATSAVAAPNTRASTLSGNTYSDGHVFGPYFPERPFKPRTNRAGVPNGNAPLPAQCTAKVIADLHRDFDNPELMSIGDSLYNGVQSLKINWWLSEWSPPAQIAARLGLIQVANGRRTGRRSFFTPQYPDYGHAPGATENFGLDLENLPSGSKEERLYALARMPRLKGGRLRYLMDEYRVPNGRPFVENIAFMGANTRDLLSWTPADYRASATRLLDDITYSGAGEQAALYGESFTLANAAFVLNPTRNPCIEAMTPLQQVEFRRPRNLLINVGANNGIWKAAFEGATLASNACTSPKVTVPGRPDRCPSPPFRVKDFLEEYPTGVGAILQRLSKVNGLKVVYVNGIGEPSRAANLRPYPERGGVRTTEYRTELFNERRLAARDLDALNRAVRDANDRVRNAVNRLNTARGARATGPLFVYVDLNATLAAYDFKGCIRLHADQRLCKNYLLPVQPAWFNTDKLAWMSNRRMLPWDTPNGQKPPFKAGGLFSFDNMHLSTIGYALMAETVLRYWDRHDGRVYGPVGCDTRGAMGAPGSCRPLPLPPGYTAADNAFLFQRNFQTSDFANREFLQLVMNFGGGGTSDEAFREIPESQ